jgi:hypothetical protein
MHPAAPEQCALLNQVFWLVLYSSLSWRSMSCLSCDTAEDSEQVEQLVDSQYLSIAASTSRSGRALPAVPKISKDLVMACLVAVAGLVAVSPYRHGPFNSRAKGVTEHWHASAEAMKNLNKLKNKPFMAYLKHKLGEWYSKAPRPLLNINIKMIYYSTTDALLLNNVACSVLCACLLI